MHKRKRLMRGFCLSLLRTTQQWAISNKHWWNWWIRLLDQKSNCKAIMRGDRQNHTRRPVTHLLSQNSPLSKMADCYKREAWALGTSTLISTEEAHFYRGSWFLRRSLISTAEADFHGGALFPLRRSISKQQAYICMENTNNCTEKARV